MLASRKLLKLIFGSKTEFGSYDPRKFEAGVSVPVWNERGQKKPELDIDPFRGVLGYLIDRIEVLEKTVKDLSEKPTTVKK